MEIPPELNISGSTIEEEEILLGEGKIEERLVGKGASKEAKKKAQKQIKCFQLKFYLLRKN